MNASAGVIGRAAGAAFATVVMLLAGLVLPVSGAASAGAAPAAAVSAAGGFVSVSPSRVMDTRVGLGGPALAAGAQRKLKVTGGSVPAGVSAVVLNVTVTQPTAGGYLTVWAGGASRPNASSLNFVKGQTIPNLVVAPVNPSTGEVMFYAGSSGSLHLLADVSGYFVPGAATAAGTFKPIAPTRVMDTRSNLGATRFTANAQRDLALPPATVPAGVSAVVLNVTVTQPVSGGYVTVWAQGSPRPTASSLNFVTGQTIPNLVVAPVNPATGKISFFAASSGTHMLADVAGYFVKGTPTVPGAYKAVAPTRLMDTRFGTGAAQFAGSKLTQDLQVTGAVVPANVTAAVMNVTVTQPAAGGWVTVWPQGVAKPNASNLNYVKGQTIPNAVFAGVSGTTGKTSYYSSAATHMLADVSGYFLPDPPPDPVPANTIKGKVSAVDGKVTAVNAWLIDQDGDVTLERVEPAADGTYSISGLTAGTYKVCFDRASGPSLTGYTGECVADKAWTRPSVAPAGSQTFTVSNNAGAAGADAVFAKAGGIKGTVSGVSGALSDVSVSVFKAGAPMAVAGGYTKQDGTYEVGYLTPGEAVQVCFDHNGEGGPATGYAPECHNNVAWSGADQSAPGATSVTPAAGAFTTVNATLGAGGAISGKVTDGPSQPVVGAGIVVFSGSRPVAYGWTDDLGNYSVTGLASGSYVVCVDGRWAEPSASGYTSECRVDKAWAGDATPPPAGTTATPVTAGNTTTGVNFQVAVRPPTSIVGTVTDGAGPVRNAVVVAVNTTTGTEFSEYTSDEDGTYRLDRLDPGSYKLCFDPTYAWGPADKGTGYAAECHNNVVWDGNTDNIPAAATTVTATSGTTQTVNAVVAPRPAGTVKGLVSDGSGGIPYTGVILVNTTTQDQFYVETEEDGTYSTGVLPGAYKVCFDGWGEASGAPIGYQPECHNNVVWGGDTDIIPAGAQTITVTNGGTSTVNAQLAALPHGTIGGKVTSASGGAAVFDASVIAINTTNGDEFYAHSGEDGMYSVKVAPGTYRVCFDGSYAGPAPVGYLSECHADKAWQGDTSSLPAGTTTVTVAADGTVTVNAALAPRPSGTIAGTVSGSGGTVADVGVRATNTSTGEVLEFWTAEDGIYSIPVPVGSYWVCFDGSWASGSAPAGYLSECHNNRPWDPESDSLPTGMTSVTVNANATMTVNATLSPVPSGTVTGTISETGGPVVDAEVYLINPTTGDWHSTYSQEDGIYSLAVPVGSWRLCVDARYAWGPSVTAVGYASECHNNQPWGRDPDVVPAGATALNLTAGSTQTVDVTVAPPPVGHVTGKVTDGGGAPLEWASVVAYNHNTGEEYWAETGAEGTYSLPVLTGSWAVCVSGTWAEGSSANGYLSECWNNVAWDGDTSDPAPAGSTMVSVTAPNTVSNINFSLAAAGGISGNVTSSSGYPGSVDIYVFNAAGDIVAWTGVWADEFDTSYHVKGLPAGTYRICFDGQWSDTPHSAECYANQAWIGDGEAPSPGATSLAVTAGATKTGVNEQLAPQ